MKKLPLHPVVFIILYLLLACVAVFPTSTGSTWSFYSAIGGTAAALGLQILWSFQALSAASSSAPDAAGARIWLVRARYGVLLLVLCLGLLAANELVQANGASLPAPLVSVSGALSSVCGSLGAVSFFGIFFAVARGICDAERARSMSKVGAVATFFLLVYMVIGAPFIYGRLKKLSGQPVGPAALTA